MKPAFPANDLVVESQCPISMDSQTRGDQGTGEWLCAFIKLFDVSKATSEGCPAAGCGEACGCVEESELLRRLLCSGRRLDGE